MSLPIEIQNRIWLYLRHPLAELVHFQCEKYKKHKSMTNCECSFIAFVFIELVRRQFREKRRNKMSVINKYVILRR